MLVTHSGPTLCDATDCGPPGSLFMGFSRQEHWSGLARPSPGDLPDPGIKPGSPTQQADSLPSESLFITYNLESTKIFLKENRGRVYSYLTGAALVNVFLQRLSLFLYRDFSAGHYILCAVLPGPLL